MTHRCTLANRYEDTKNKGDLLFGAVNELVLIAPLEALLNAPVFPQGLDDSVEFLKAKQIVDDYRLNRKSAVANFSRLRTVILIFVKRERYLR